MCSVNRITKLLNCLFASNEVKFLYKFLIPPNSEMEKCEMTLFCLKTWNVWFPRRGNPAEYKEPEVQQLRQIHWDIKTLNNSNGQRQREDGEGEPREAAEDQGEGEKREGTVGENPVGAAEAGERMKALPVGI